MNMNPCKNCKDREPECHAICEKYITWQAEHQEKIKAINNIKYADCEFMNMARERKNKRERRKRCQR